MFCDHITVITVLIRHFVQHQLAVHLLLRILLEILQNDVETGDIVILTVHIFDRNICPHLGEGLEHLCEGEIVLVGDGLCIF